MNPIAYVDDNVRQRPRPLMALPLTWCPDCAVQCHTAARQVLRTALAACRTRRGRALLEQQLQDLDDRMLRDVGMDPSTVPRSVRVELMPLLFAQWLR